MLRINLVSNRWLTALLLLMLITPSMAQRQKIELLNADYNANRMVNGKMTSTLAGNVSFRWGETVIKADTTIWYRSENILKLLGVVKIKQGTQNLRCSNAVFYGKEKRILFNGTVTAVDSSRKTTITAERATYFLEEDSLVLHRKPKIHFWSTTTSDTVTIAGREMYYAGESERARATSGVTITGKKITGKADTILYDRGKEWADLTGRRPLFTYSNSSIEGDFLHCTLTDNALTGLAASGKPKATTIDTADTNITTSILSGDSLLFRISNNHIDTIFAKKNALATRQLNDDFRRIDSLWGETITTAINKDNSGSSVAVGNAQSIYTEEKSRNRVASNSITLYFEDTGIEKVVLKGAVQGIIYEDK